MKWLLPWLVAALALVAATHFYISKKSKSEELAKIQSQIQQLENLRAGNPEIKNNQVSDEELGRLRKNAEELLRLRDEVRRLHDASQTANSAAELAQEQLASAQAPALTSATNADHSQTPEQQAFFARHGVDPRNLDQYGFCLLNVQQIDRAKAQWALENRNAAGLIPSGQDLVVYLKDASLPMCPDGGTYTLNAVGTKPICSISRHAPPHLTERNKAGQR